jgi:hypothetical protein
MIIGRLHAIPNWDTASTSSVEPDDLPSLTDAEWENLEDSQYKLNPLWPENTSDSLPPELQPFLLSRPLRPQHLQVSQTNLASGAEREHSISEESSLFGDKTDHSELSSLFGDDETDHTMDEESSLFGDKTDHSKLSSLFGDDETDHTMDEESSLFGDSDETDLSVNKTSTSTPASLPQDHVPLPNVGFQPPVGQQYAWTPPHVGLQHPGVRHVPQMPSSVKFQPLPGPHYYWMPPNLGTNGMPMMPPSNPTYPYAINTAFPPSTQFYPSANAFTAPPLSTQFYPSTNAFTAPHPNTSLFRHRAYIPGMGKWIK